MKISLNGHRNTVLLGVLLILTFLSLHSVSSSQNDESKKERSVILAQLPPVMLWAWERKEDLMFIDTKTVGVAYLSRSIQLVGDKVISYPRMQPMKVPAKTALIALVRIDTRDWKPALTKKQREICAHLIAKESARAGVRALQIDFEAKKSERTFYRALLADVRQQLPPSVPLLITALSSWCMYETWVDDLPVDEAVPMLYEMGKGDDEVRSYLAKGNDFRATLCRESVGIGTHEVPPSFPLSRRRYVFSPRHWTPESVNFLTKEKT